MIFPGMDPYLEDATLWPGVHASMIVYVRNHLQPRLQPRYVAAIEERVYVEGVEQERIPDVWVRRQRRRVGNGAVAVLEADTPVVVQVPAGEYHETYVTILDKYSDLRLITVIELVSPTNKYAGPGRDSYVNKQQEVLRSKAHLVEIDLHRTGNHVLAVAEWAAKKIGAHHYLACVNRAVGERDKYDLYPSVLEERLPRIRIPLAGDDPDVPLDIQAVLEQAYEDGCYLDRIHYDRPCQPPLTKQEQVWANQMIKKAGLLPANGRRKSAPRRKR